MAAPLMGFGFYGMSQLSTLPARASTHFQECLVISMSVAADVILLEAQSQLVPGHGYDTGLLHDSLVKNLVEVALAGGVFYTLSSDAAEYWADVEFGHLQADGSFWPGYHYLSQAVENNRVTVFAAAAEAWRLSAGILDAESAAMLGGGLMKL